MFAPFRYPVYLAIWLSSMVSNFGGVIQGVAATWLMLELTHSPQQVALVQAATTAPIMLFSLFAGTVADLFDRRRVMLAAQCISFAASLVLSLLAAEHLVTPGVLLAATFAIGTGSALYLPAWQASIIEQVPRQVLPAAVALNGINFNVVRSVAPAIAGVILASSTAVTAFTINSLSYLGLIVVLAGWRRQMPPAKLGKEQFGRATAAGIRFVMLSPRLHVLLLRGFQIGTGGAALWALMPLLARDVMGGGPTLYGGLLAAFGGGAMAGALASGRIRARLGSHGLAAGAAAVYAACSLLAGLHVYTPLTFLILFVGGAGWLLTLMTLNVMVQIASPRWVAGRSIAVYQVVTYGGLAVGSAFWGFIARQYGTREALVASGLCMLVTLFLLRRRRILDEAENLEPVDPSLPNIEPIYPDPRTGPIVVSLEYRIRAEDAEAFAAAIDELSLIRRREGAVRWALTQDLYDPEIWNETFSSPTWLDHLRRNGRWTAADQAARDRVWAFHQGDRPLVRLRAERPPGAGPVRFRNDPEADEEPLMMNRS